MGNNFDFLRLLAAVAVIFSHAFALTGSSDGEPLGKLSGQTTVSGLAVGAFFVISGYLIALSWDRTRSARAFLRNRTLRILPGLAGAVLFCAFIVGPLVTTSAEYFDDPRTYAFIAARLTFIVYYDYLPGVFADNPFPAAVNSSLWTLKYEVLCYLTTLALGVCGLLRLRYILPLLVALLFAAMLGAPDGGTVTLTASFAAGAALYLARDAVPVDRRLAAVAAAALIAALLFDGYRVVFPVAGAYLVYWLALNPAIRLQGIGRRGDFSYGLYIYAFPVQQIIAWLDLDGGIWLANFALALPVTLLLAVASWHLIERPALSLKTSTARPGAPIPMPVEPG